MNIIYTIGHSNHPILKLIEILKINEIELVVDVRRFPTSKHNPQFNKPLLKSALENSGIGYQFMGEKLGGKGDLKEISAKPEFDQGILELVEMVNQEKKVTILCAEENPQNCHRQHLLTPALEAKGLKVSHIRGDGKLETVKQLRLFPEIF